MKAVLFDAFRQPLRVEAVPDPAPAVDGVVVRVEATGLCRSDWHAWMGHDPDVRTPHVPGHEFAGVVEAVGGDVRRWVPGDRVTVPFVCACGRCAQCLAGDHQVCVDQFQPGFTGWGSFAQFVAVPRADINVVRLPDALGYVEAAGLGCRFSTAFRALVEQARVKAGEWVAVHGCGGVGLSAVMIAVACGGRVVAVDLSDEALVLARSFGAEVALRSEGEGKLVEEIRSLTGGGAHVSMDALGHTTTCRNSILCLRPRGRHVQVGLMLAEMRHPALPMDVVIARELELRGSHGMQAHAYGPLLELIAAGRLHPGRLVSKAIGLDEVPAELAAMGRFHRPGVTVVDRLA